MRLPLVALFMFGLSPLGQALAQEAEVQEQQTAEQVVEVVDQQALKTGKVCQVEDVTGSRMRKRVCYTPEQWRARERAGKELTRDLDGKMIYKDGQGG